MLPVYSKTEIFTLFVKLLYNLNMTEKYQKSYIIESQKVLHFTFNNFKDMERYGKNWSFYDFFRYGTQPFKGRYDIYQHKDFQIANAIYEDGLMYKGYAPKNTITLAIIINKKGSLTVNQIPLNHNEILIMDDLSEYDTVFSQYVQIGTISMRKEFVNMHFPYLNHMINKVYIDTNSLLTNIIEQLTNNTECHDQSMKSQLIENIKRLSFKKQTVIPKKLSKKESLIFDIRKYLIKHAEENIPIENLALKFGMSDKTLQTIFKKIFGHTPKKFMKLLKLNLTYRDITEDNRSSETISKIAMKYGFNNFGLFSQKFKTMYGILPSKIGKTIS